MVTQQLPSGPRMPAVLQTLGTWKRPTAVIERARRRYGTPFTMRLLGQPPFVLISRPEEIQQIFQSPPDVLHPGEGARILEPVVGANSVILLDESPHLEQRKLLLPAFHGQRMQQLAGVMQSLTEEELDSWPLHSAFAVHPRLQRLTLEIILRAVFGLQGGARLDAMRSLLTEVLSFGESPLSLLPIPRHPVIQRLLRARGPIARLERLMGQVDELLLETIEERRQAGGEGEDVLALLLGARHEDGSEMSAAELRDELMTALVAGHETTASQLAWAFERLSHAPHVLHRLYEELDDGTEERYLTATINEILRLEPVLPNAEPRLVKKPVRIGDVTYPPGVVLIASAYLLHHDPEIYPDPHAFKPERFVDRQPGTYTWIPFGGGRRRCLGASFALLEMRIVLRAALERFDLRPASPRPERRRRRSITISPAASGTVLLARRAPVAPRTAESQHTPAAA